MKPLLTVLLALLSVTALAADLPQPGLYKVTAKISSEQMPIGGTHASEECLKENQFLQDPEAWMSEQPGQDCEVVEYDVADGKIKMVLSCTITQGGKASIVGTGTYTNNSFQMNNKMIMNASGMDMEINTAISGEHQGGC